MGEDLSNLVVTHAPMLIRQSRAVGLHSIIPEFPNVSLERHPIFRIAILDFTRMARAPRTMVARDSHCRSLANLTTEQK
jgi:hypothetical protein